MHTFNETGAGVPAFLAKLWRLVEDPETNNLICWSKDGRSFIIQNQAQFSRDLLPLNYKHNNMASFIRQLNMYGFHKITSIENGGLKFDRDDMEFSHPCFKRNHPYLLEHIKRKIANTKAIDDKTTVKPEAVSKVLNDVKAMRGRQDSLDSRFSVMKQENEALWREIASLRQKHSKQQQIINKLIQFLITIVQPSRNMTSVKRNMQLMIDDNIECKKIRNTSESESDCGPIIHELGEELLDEVTSDVDLPESPSSLLFNSERPQSNGSSISQNYEYSSNSQHHHTATCPSPGASSIINAVNADGSQIVYHVTEVPDNHPIDSKILISNNLKNCTDDNILTTPMLKQAIARGELKNKNKQRRKITPLATTTTTTTTAKRVTSVDSNPNITSSAKLIKTSDKEKAESSFDKIKIKTETTNEIDPSIFLNFNYTTDGNHYVEKNDNLNAAIDPRVILPDPTDDSQQSEMDATGDDHDATEMYNTLFDSDDMPSDLFEDPMLIDESNYKNAKSQSEQINLSPAPRTTSNISPSPSSSSSSTSLVGNGKTTIRPVSRGKNMKTLALTKYSPSKSDYESERDDISGHVEGVQDELDSLKDLLRSDEYSIDANTLLSNGPSSNNRVYLNHAVDCGDLLQKLFGDSDILGSYGLPVMLNDSSQERKGSELMTYQPIYDLSDIMDINGENQIEDEEAANKASSSKQLSPNSNLNTPYHE